MRRYTYAKTVQNLTAPASYRMVVRFRWLDAEGDVVRALAPDLGRRAASPTCAPTSRRGGSTSRPARRRTLRRYVVAVRNAGAGPAVAPFAVGLRVGGAGARSAADARPRGGPAARSVTFVGPACAAGEPLAVTVDPAERVDERDEDDNVLDCPLRAVRRAARRRPHRLRGHGRARASPPARSPHELRARYDEAFRAWLDPP